MRNEISPLILLGALTLFVPLAACSDDGGDTAGDSDGTSGDGDGDASGDGDGDAATGDGDGDGGDDMDAMIIEMAQDYTNWNLVNAAPFQSAGHDGGNAVVNIYVPDAIADQYKAIDPANPQPTTFAEGSIIVKEHVDAEGNYVMATVMYKGPDGFSESGNWWWAMGDLVGGEMMTGQLDGCIGCHSAYPDTDWLVGVPAADQNP